MSRALSGRVAHAEVQDIFISLQGWTGKRPANDPKDRDEWATPTLAHPQQTLVPNSEQENISASIEDCPC